MRESEERFELALRGADLGLWDWNVETGGVIFNECWAKMLGYSLDEIEPHVRGWEKLLHPEDTPRVMKVLKENLDGKTNFYETEFRLRAKDGCWKWILARGMIFERDETGKPLRSVGTHLDINERKQAEELLRKAHDELEQRVKERTAELVEANEQLKGEIEDRKIAEEEKTKLQSQLQQAQKMESIGTLAGGIAHDFNNMLGIIVGNTELAMDDIPDWNPAKQNLEEIRIAGMRARDMVKRIMAFSRQTPLEMKPVRISPIIKESLKLLRSSIPTTIEIQQNISIESDTIRADPTQINQVLINLCTNAAHDMGEKGGILEVSLKNIEMDEESAIHYYKLSSGKYVRLTVSDTGNGIEPKILKRIFDPYFTTKGVGEGSGMGLSVVHGIVKSHGGGISVGSEPGKGTIFHILFPCIEDKPEPEVEIAVEITGGNERILFVDDEKAMVDAIRPMIERLGYKLTARTSSIEALDAFRANPGGFDLVITDFTMPNMTGMELAKALFKLRSDIPVILCTGYSEHINENKAKAIGVRAFLMKPVALSEIANTIRKVLDDDYKRRLIPENLAPAI